MASEASAPNPISFPRTRLIGRDDDLARVAMLLARADVRLLTLTGPGGVGKTRLALEIARTADREWFSEVVTVMLSTVRDAAGVLPAIARGIGQRQIAALPLEHAITTGIGDRAMLLVLDNAEHVLAAMEALPTILAGCPRVTVLVTSRSPLRLSAEHLYPVEPLATARSATDAFAPATALFIERALAARPDLPLTPANITAIDAVCGQLDGLPLAIELAASRSRFLSPAALLARLSERLRVLVGGPRDAPERHQTIRATLAWSHELLSVDERTLFQRLAIFENGAPLDAVDPVCNPDGDLDGNVEDILSALVDHSLVRIIDQPVPVPRVRMLVTIREFAREQLVASGELEAIAKAHADWFTSLVTDTPETMWRTGTDELHDWVLMHESDAGNFRVALEYQLAAEDKAPAVRLAGILTTFWADVGLLADAFEWVERVIPFAADAPLDVQARFYLEASGIFGLGLRASHLERAIQLGEHTLALADQLRSPLLKARISKLLGRVHLAQGDIDAGERWIRRAIAIAQAIPDPLFAAICQANLGEDLMWSGELERGEPLLREAIPVIERERPALLPLFAGPLAHLALRRGNLDEAGTLLEQGLGYHIEPPHREPLDLADRLCDAAHLAGRRGRPEAGARLLGATSALLARMGVTDSGLSSFLLGFAETALRSTLDNAAMARERAAGAGLSIPAAIEVALEVARLRSDAGPPSSAAEAFGLTPRQQEILELLMAGKSNAAIADALYLSERTVGTHLTRIYDRLGVSSRAEAIALAHRLGAQPPPSPRRT